MLDAKGGEIKAKANGSATTWEFWKYKNYIFLICPKYSYCKIWSLVGENFLLWEKGEFLVLDQSFHWNISWFAQTSVFGLEIGERIWFTKTNQVVAKNDPNMSNLVQKQFGSKLHWCCTSFGCFWMSWHKSPKRRDWKGNVPLSHLYIVLVIKCATYYV